jgi:hypothetical protein
MKSELQQWLSGKIIFYHKCQVPEGRTLQYVLVFESLRHRGDNLRRPNAIPKGWGERTDQSESAACPPHLLSNTIDMEFGD